MKAHQRVTRWRDQGGEAGQEVGWGHHAVGMPAAGILHAISDATIAKDDEAVEAERGASAVTQESLAAFAVARGNRNGGVDVEASR